MVNFMQQLHEDDIAIILHLRERLKCKNPCFYKAKHLAQELGGRFTSRMVGSRLALLAHVNCGITIKDYADNGSSVTWRIESAETY